MRKSLFIFSFLYLFCYLVACGQNANGVPPALRYKLSAKHFTSRHGLAANTIWNMFQDQQGFIWLNTADGINRYDGKTFKLYEKSEYGYATYQTSDGTLWLCTVSQGLKSLDLRTGKVKLYKHKKNDVHTISDNRVVNMYEVQPGNLWVNTLHGLNNLTIRNKKVVSITRYFFGSDTIRKSKNHYFRKLLRDVQGNIWGALNNTLYKFFANELNPECFEKYKITHPVFNNITRIYEDKQKRFWVGAESGLGIFDRNTGKVILKGFKNHNIFAIYQDSRNIVWIGTNKGLYWLDEQTSTFVQFKSYQKVLESLGDSSVGYIFEDKSGALWVGSIGSGLYQLEVKSHKFSFCKIYSEDKEEQNKKLSFWNIQTDKQHLLWLKARNKKGVFSFDYTTGQVKHYRHNTNNNQSISHDYVTCMYKDKLGRVWVATRDGVNLINKDNATFKRYYPVPDGNNRVGDILEDARKNLIVHVVNKGLYKYNEKSDIFEEYISFKHSVNRAMLIDQNDVLWMDTNIDKVTYLCLIDLKTGKKTTFGAEQGLKDYGILHIYQAKSGQIWLASYGGGLIKAVKQPDNGLSLKYYGKKDGLKNAHVYGVQEDAQGTLWLSHNKGLSRFNPVTETFENYAADEGIQDAEFMEDAFSQAQDGRLFFGGAKGINMFYPKDIVSNKYSPPVVLTDFRILNQSVTPHTSASSFKETINFTKEITLTYEQARSFSFEFAALSYIRPERNLYKVKLENYDRAWSDLNTRNLVNYTNIPPGNYVFKVQGANSDGFWNIKDLKINIIILPAWWQTWWFKASWISAIALLVFGFYRIRINSINKQKKILEYKVMVRTEEVMMRTREVVTQKEEIMAQYDAIEGQNKRIRQSLKAAQTIQEAILPFDVLMQKMLKEYFVIYRPKDVVSGDFYWLGQVQNKRIVAAVDCTGHGIPGAFMSLIGFTMLNEIINVSQVTEPAKILEELRHNIRYTLRQDETGGRNGMDLVLITIEDTDDEQIKVCFAGAKRPLWYIERDSTETQEIEGSSVSIGIIYRKERYIKTKSFTCQRGTRLYLSTDGFPDQNDIYRKRLGSRTLMDLLFKSRAYPLDEQKKALETSLDAYMTGTDQRDDILLIGILV